MPKAPVTAPSDIVMVRSRDAGVFYGQLVSRNRDEVILTNARRVYYWDGAATLSELATRGTSKPAQCKFPAPTSGKHLILGVCEVIPVTAEALKSLEAVKVWRA
jgi:hypothetical protein